MTDQEKFQGNTAEFLDMQFGKKNGLFADTLNIWHNMFANIGGEINENSNLENINPLPHYEEYLDKYSKTGEKDYLMSKSNPESIKLFDTLVDEFNSNIKRIKEERDVGYIKNMYKKAALLVTENPDQAGMKPYLIDRVN